MDLSDKITEIAKRYNESKKILLTEEATKNALIMPFIQALGYDIFDPKEVIPEYIADHGVKKGEKVDYAILSENRISIIIECKKVGSQLSSDIASQLYRYFAVSDAHFGLLTNGSVYMFYTDLDKPNTMDLQPFFIFNLESYEEHEINELKKFTKISFNVEQILNTANDLKYTGQIKEILENELENPSDNFVKYFTLKIYNGNITQTVLEQFRSIVKNARKQFINDQIKERLNFALNNQDNTDEELQNDVQDNKQLNDGIVTTEDEIEAFYIIKSICREIIDPSRVGMRDAKTYCAILFDGNNRFPICRLRFNGKKYYLGTFKEKIETKVPIESLDDIYKYSTEIIATVKGYIKK